MKRSFKLCLLLTLTCLGCYILVSSFSNDSHAPEKPVARDGYKKLSVIIGDRLNRMWVKNKVDHQKEMEHHDKKDEGDTKDEAQEEVKEQDEKQEEVKEQDEKQEEVKEQDEKQEEVKEQDEKQEEVKEQDEKQQEVDGKKEKQGKSTEEKKKDKVKPTLPACPEVSPKLVGPIKVDFSPKRVLDVIDNKGSKDVQEGGRYKPKDCYSRHKVAIIIPFRHREQHLAHWLHYLHPILKRQQIDYGVYVVNQAGEGIFNRAKLMNVGYLEAIKDYDYNCFVFSDVDLVPMDDRNLYRCFDEPRHLAVAMDKFNFKLPYNTFFGGVSSLSKEQFEQINGFPNTYWGWGGEDDDIYKRIVFKKMSISRPSMLIGKYKMVRHKRDVHNESNPKNPDKLRKTLWTMELDGINDVEYLLRTIERKQLYTFLDVNIRAPAR